MGIQIGCFLPSQEKPCGFPLLDSRMRFDSQEVMESLEPFNVVDICSIRALLVVYGFQGQHGLEDPVPCCFDRPTPKGGPVTPRLGVRLWSRCDHTFDAFQNS